jgi:hypothetical protein
MRNFQALDVRFLKHWIFPGPGHPLFDFAIFSLGLFESRRPSFQSAVFCLEFLAQFCSGRGTSRPGQSLLEALNLPGPVQWLLEAPSLPVLERSKLYGLSGYRLHLMPVQALGCLQDVLFCLRFRFLDFGYGVLFSRFGLQSVAICPKCQRLAI